MKLYRVRDKKTGKYLSSGSFCDKKWRSWTSTGVFFKRIDTVRNHIDNLCYTYESVRVREFCFPYWKRKDKIPNEVDRYEVVVNDVILNGEYVINAKDLLK